MVTIVEQLEGVAPQQIERQAPTPTTTITREQQIQQNLSRVAQERKIEQARLDDLQQRKLEPGLTSSERNAIDNRIAESTRLLIQLSKAKANIERGFTFESAIGQATQVAGAETKRIETGKTIRLTSELISQGITEFRDFVSGKLLGFRDEVSGQTASVRDIREKGFAGFFNPRRRAEQQAELIKTGEFERLQKGRVSEERLRLDELRRVDTPFTFEKATEPQASFGAIFVTPKEAEQFAGLRLPLFELESKDISGAIVESRKLVEVGGVQVSPSSAFQDLFGRTEEAFKFEQASIIGAKKRIKKLEEIEEQLILDPTFFIGQEKVEVIETEKGKEVILTPAFLQEKLDFGKESILEARKRFGELPKISRVKSRVSSVLFGATGVGVGLVEFGGTLFTSLGVQKFEEDEEFKAFSLGKQFRFGGELERITTSPDLPTTTTFLESPLQFIKEKATSPKLITEVVGTGGLILVGGGGALKNIRKLGVRGGVVETAGMFSPIRIKSQIFTSPIKETSEVDVLSFKVREGDLNIRSVIGRGRKDPFIIDSTQITKQLPGGRVEVGSVKTIIEQPALLFRGGKFIEGTQISTFKGLVKGRGGREIFKVSEFRDLTIFKDIPKFRGGLGESLTRPTSSVFLTPKGRGFGELFIEPKFRLGREAGFGRQLGEGVDFFGAGRRVSIPETIVEGDVVIRRPSGRFKFKPTLKGLEFDLNKILQSDPGVGKGADFSSFRGRGKLTPLSKTFQEQTLTSQISSIRTAISFKVKPPKIDTKTPLPTKPSVQTTTQKDFTTTLETTILDVKQKPFVLEKEAFAFPSRVKSALRERAREEEKLVSRLGLSSLLSPAVRQEVAQRSLERTIQKTLSKQLQRQKIIPRQIRTIKELKLRPQKFARPKLIPLKRFPGPGRGKKKGKQKRGRGRTRVSFTGIVLGIKEAPFISKRFGVAPFEIRGLETGRKGKSRKLTDL